MKKIVLALALGCLAATAWAADVKVEHPWVRATVAEQSATGAFMTITSSENARLVGASSPVANVVQVHEMAMEKDVMRMRELVDGLELPAGKPVELKPGGYHIMLMGLKLEVVEGNDVPLTLDVVDASGKHQKVNVVAEVHSLTARADDAGHMHKGMQ